jgi:Flp pilus assembly protein TadD
VAIAIVAMPVAVSLAAPGIAARLTSSAISSVARSPAAAMSDLELASRFDFLSARPLVVEGVLARRLGRLPAARRALARAIDREPSNWFAHLELALLDARLGHRTRALRHLAVAVRLDPRQPVLRTVARRLRAGREVDPSQVERVLYGQLRSKLHATRLPG